MKNLAVKKVKRNTVSLNTNGDYSMNGLNKYERKSLKSKRDELMRFMCRSVVDQYIIALYDEEENEIYFVDEKWRFSAEERAIII